MVLPTTKELMEQVGRVYYSVAYGDNRTILKNLHSPVACYGIGFAGFIVVIKTKRGYLKGYAYSVKHILRNYGDGGFSEVDVDTAINEINNGKLFVKKEFDEEAFKDGKIRKDYDSERPVLATLSYVKRENNSSYDEGQSLRLVRLKNKKIRAESLNNWRETYSRCCLNYFLQEYERIIDKKKGEEYEISNDWHGKVKVVFKEINIGVPEEILTEAKDQELVSNI